MSFNSFDISASGLYAQRVNMDTISSNIANINTTRNEKGEAVPYVRKQVIFSNTYNDAMNNFGVPSGNVSPNYNSSSGSMSLKGHVSFDNSVTSNGITVNQIAEDKNPYKSIYDPSHPDSDKDGFVQMPNINIVTEMVDMMKASKAYEANATTAEATKSMITAAMRI